MIPLHICHGTLVASLSSGRPPGCNKNHGASWYDNLEMNTRVRVRVLGHADNLYLGFHTYTSQILLLVTLPV